MRACRPAAEKRSPHGLRFGPDPSTSTRATLGGMIGNNACGPHAVAWGRTADNVVELSDAQLKVLLADPNVAVGDPPKDEAKK